MKMRHRPLAVQIFSFLLVAVIALVMQAFFVRLVWAAAPGSFFAYISNYHSNTVSVIDTTYNTVVATVPVGTNPYGVAVHPTGSRAYVTNTSSGTVSVIDTGNNTVVDTVYVETEPMGVAVHPTGSRAYVANYHSNTVSVIDTGNNTVVATVYVGRHPYGVAVHPTGSRVYVTNSASGNVSVIDTSNNSVVATVTVMTEPMGVAVNPTGSRVYVTNEFSGNVSVIDTSINTRVATVPVGTKPRGVAVNPTGSRVYVTNRIGGTVSVIDTGNNTVVANVPVGEWPYGVAVDPTGSHVYVTNAGSGSVSVLDTYSNTVVATITVGSTPAAFGKFIIGTINPLVIINIAAIPGVTAPATGATPVTAITETAQYTGTVAWSPALSDGKFAPGTVYTATITLTAKPGFSLTGVAANQFTVAGATATNAAGSGFVTAIFPATAAAVINLPAIPGVTAPVTGATPVAAITESAQYTGTVTWSPALVGGKFAPGTAYTATITLTAKPGFTLTGVAANQFTVAGATATNAAGSGVVTAVFPATAAAAVPAAPGGWGDAAPATPVVTAPDVQRAAGALVSKGFSAAEAKQGVTVEAGALKEMRDLGREVRVNTPQAAVVLPPRLAQALLGQDAGSMIIVSVTPGVGDLPPPTAQLWPAGADVEVVARVKQGAREVNLEGERHLILTYDPRRVQNPSRLGVYRWEKGMWRYVGGKADTATNTVRVRLTGFSRYAVFENVRTFNDLAGHWAVNDIHILNARYIANGLPANNFVPNRTVTRAEFATMVVNALEFAGHKVQDASAKTFTDVPSDAWYATAVRTAAEAGLVSGYADGTFRPERTITREEAAALTIRLLRHLGVKMPSAPESALQPYRDAGEVGVWARATMAAAAQTGIIVGTPERKLIPADNLTRAQAAVFLKRVLAKADQL